MSAIRELNVDKDTCIGCQACANVCPEVYITRADKGSVRTVQFAGSCAVDCTRCEEACSENAISLTPSAEVSPGYITLEFPLLQCTGCSAPYATEKMVNKTRASIAGILGGEDCAWTSMCPSCRRVEEALGAAQQHMLARAGMA